MPTKGLRAFFQRARPLDEVESLDTVYHTRRSDSSSTSPNSWNSLGSGKATRGIRYSNRNWNPSLSECALLWVVGWIYFWCLVPVIPQRNSNTGHTGNSVSANLRFPRVPEITGNNAELSSSLCAYKNDSIPRTKGNGTGIV